MQQSQSSSGEQAAPSLALWPRRSLRVTQIVGSAGMVLGLVLVYLYLASGASSTSLTGRRDLIDVMLVVVLVLGSLSILAFRAYTGRIAALWRSSITLSVLCVAALAGIWYLTLAVDHLSFSSQGMIVRDQASVDRHLAEYTSAQEPPFLIPTGLFIQSINFTSANNVLVTGYVWQRYADNLPADLVRGVVLPEAEEIDIQDAYKVKQGQDTLYGWYFKATLREAFDYARFPFDRQEVWVRLWQKDFVYNIILVPDFAAYPEIEPGTLPGVEKDFVLNGWDFDGSYFLYRPNEYSTNFGFADYDVTQEPPELYFNLGVQRDFMNVFLGQLIPLIVVAVLLFAILLISTTDEQRAGSLGFSASTVLGYCAALFFVVIVSHNQLRSTLPAPTIMYLEYFYFALYLVILLVSLNAILLSSSQRSAIIAYRDNLLPRLLFWPTLLGLLLAITVWTFY